MKQEKERILKLVEDGMLTAQEALTLIENWIMNIKKRRADHRIICGGPGTCGRFRKRGKRKPKAVARGEAVRLD